VSGQSQARFDYAVGCCNRSKEKLKKNATDAKAAKQWEAGHIISLAMAEGVALWGLVIRMVFHGTLWQASIFYVMALFLLLLWTPRMPGMAAPI
jgi:hypothetical protein